jgi:phosphoglycerol transferase MdoB-like AlkP superfamily enzyme
MVEALIVTWIFLVFFVFSKKTLFSFLTSQALYITFIIVNSIKIKLLYSPLLPIDFLQINELMQSKDFFISLIPKITLFLVFIILILFLTYKYDRTKKYIHKYFKKIFLVPLILIFLPLFLHSNIKKDLRHHGIFYKKNSNLVVHYLTKGFLTSFVQIFLYSDEYKPPTGYSSERIKDIVEKYGLSRAPHNNTSEPVNLIVFMVESLTNPYKMGWQTTQPALVSFTDINQNKGIIYSPVIGGKSINAEFELLTGMSTRFITTESLVYREGLSHDIPSLARFLKTQGYNTIAMRDEPIDKYGFKIIYDYLGFDEAISFTKMKLSKDPTNVHSSSLDIADTIIEKSKTKTPFFMFNFTMSSHAPWSGQDYKTSLDFIYPNKFDKNVKNQMKGYLNSINHMDKAIKKLKDYFRNSNKKVVLLVVGDHQPLIKEYRDKHSVRFSHSDSLYYLATHRMDAVVWDNFNSTHKEFELSMNLIPSYLLNKIGLETCGIMKFNNELKTFSNIITQYIHEDGKFRNDSQNKIMEDYELLQYDIIYGKNYYTNYVSGNCL